MPENQLAHFDREISRFPSEAREHLTNLPQQCGALTATDVNRLRSLLGIDTPQLMVQLLPVAAAFARTPVSNFSVGSVAAGIPTASGDVALYLGANFEVAGGVLGLTVHAEQAASVNAWLSGETGLSSLAASAAPCGCCRQFLCELGQEQFLNIVRPANVPPGYDSKPLSLLLPQAFVPADLGIKSAFMARNDDYPRLRVFASDENDLRIAALRAAEASYAPYTGTFAGCAIRMAGGEIFVGRSVENAAYNPSLSAVQTAFVMMNMSLSRGDLTAVDRIALVECATTATQLPLTKTLVETLAPQADFEYCQATEQAG